MQFISRTALLQTALMAFLGASSLFAQMGQGPGMHQGMPRYNPATVVTVKGTIQEVQEATMQSGQTGQTSAMPHMGTHLIVKADDTTYTVLVGPTRFVKEKNFQFTKGDQIEVTGSKVNFNGNESLIAREIKKGNQVLTLRNESGIPEWSMGGQR